MDSTDGRAIKGRQSSMEKMNVLVTGGAGFIGSHLVDALVGRGHRVRVLDALVPQVHGEAGAPQYLNPEAEFVRADVCDAAAVSRALEGVDVVYHKAAEVGVGQSMYEIRRYVGANDMGTATLLESLVNRRGRLRHLLLAPAERTGPRGLRGRRADARLRARERHCAGEPPRP